MFCKNYLQVYGLSFHSPNSIFHRAKIFNFNAAYQFSFQGFYFIFLVSYQKVIKLTWISYYILNFRLWSILDYEPNEVGQRLTEFCQENALVITNILFNNTRHDFTHGHHQMVNTKIKLITFYVAKDREAVYSQQRQNLELTVAQIFNFS